MSKVIKFEELRQRAFDRLASGVSSLSDGTLRSLMATYFDLAYLSDKDLDALRECLMHPKSGIGRSE